MSALRFRARSGAFTVGTLIYSHSEYSFRFEPDADASEEMAERVGDQGVTSVAVGTLQLELGIESGIVLYPWGLHPAIRWVPGAALPNHARSGAVVVALEDEDDEGFVMGVTIGLAEVGEWSTIFDEQTGWARVAADHDQADEQQVLIASGTVLGLVGDQLNSVWLHPRFQP